MSNLFGFFERKNFQIRQPGEVESVCGGYLLSAARPSNPQFKKYPLIVVIFINYSGVMFASCLLHQFTNFIAQVLKAAPVRLKPGFLLMRLSFRHVCLAALILLLNHKIRGCLSSRLNKVKLKTVKES